MWRNPTREGFFPAHAYTAVLTLPNEIRVDALFETGKRYLRLSLSNYDRYVKVVRQLDRAGPSQDEGLVAVWAPDLFLGMDRVRFMSGRIHVCNGGLLATLFLDIPIRDFRFLVDILLNVLPRAD